MSDEPRNRFREAAVKVGVLVSYYWCIYNHSDEQSFISSGLKWLAEQYDSVTVQCEGGCDAGGY